MILVINQETNVKISYVREVITFTKPAIESEVKIDIEGNVLSMLEDLFSIDITSIILKADNGSELADYSEYGIDHLEQFIQDDIVITSIVLRNDKTISTDEVVDE